MTWQDRIFGRPTDALVGLLFRIQHVPTTAAVPLLSVRMVPPRGERPCASEAELAS